MATWNAQRARLLATGVTGETAASGAAVAAGESRAVTWGAALLRTKNPYLMAMGTALMVGGTAAAIWGVKRAIANSHRRVTPIDTPLADGSGNETGSGSGNGGNEFVIHGSNPVFDVLNRFDATGVANWYWVDPFDPTKGFKLNLNSKIVVPDITVRTNGLIGEGEIFTWQWDGHSYKQGDKTLIEFLPDLVEGAVYKMYPTQFSPTSIVSPTGQTGWFNLDGTLNHTSDDGSLVGKSGTEWQNAWEHWVDNGGNPFDVFQPRRRRDLDAILQEEHGTLDGTKHVRGTVPALFNILTTLPGIGGPDQAKILEDYIRDKEREGYGETDDIPSHKLPSAQENAVVPLPLRVNTQFLVPGAIYGFFNRLMPNVFNLHLMNLCETCEEITFMDIQECLPPIQIQDRNNYGDYWNDGLHTTPTVTNGYAVQANGVTINYSPFQLIPLISFVMELVWGYRFDDETCTWTQLEEGNIQKGTQAQLFNFQRFFNYAQNWCVGHELAVDGVDNQSVADERNYHDTYTTDAKFVNEQHVIDTLLSPKDWQDIMVRAQKLKIFAQFPHGIETHIEEDTGVVSERRRSRRATSSPAGWTAWATKMFGTSFIDRFEANHPVLQFFMDPSFRPVLADSVIASVLGFAAQAATTGAAPELTKALFLAEISRQFLKLVMSSYKLNTKVHGIQAPNPKVKTSTVESYGVRTPTGGLPVTTRPPMGPVSNPMMSLLQTGRFPMGRLPRLYYRRPDFGELQDPETMTINRTQATTNGCSSKSMLSGRRLWFKYIPKCYDSCYDANGTAVKTRSYYNNNWFSFDEIEDTAFGGLDFMISPFPNFDGYSRRSENPLTAEDGEVLNDHYVIVHRTYHILLRHKIKTRWNEDQYHTGDYTIRPTDMRRVPQFRKGTNDKYSREVDWNIDSTADGETMGRYDDIMTLDPPDDLTLEEQMQEHDGGVRRLLQDTDNATNMYMDLSSGDEEAGDILEAIADNNL